MHDPLTQLIGLLQPSASFSKLVTASGFWSLRSPTPGPLYGTVLEGSCEMTIAGRAPVTLARGAFILVPATRDVTVTSLPSPPVGSLSKPVEVRPGAFHLGEPGKIDTCMLLGRYVCKSSDSALLVSLLPELVIVRSERRLTTLVELLSEEAGANRPGREVVLARLLEVLLIEALRQTSGPTAAPGLLRGLGDERLATALRQIHSEPVRRWTVSELAREAGLSRSTFFDRFHREVGVPPMEYLSSWRMAIAKNLLRDPTHSVGEVARLVGYGSSSTFSVAFARQAGESPMTYARKTRPGRKEPFGFGGKLDGSVS